jgi:RimJ/RimL family protein N-acetyltransferase
VTTGTGIPGGWFLTTRRTGFRAWTPDDLPLAHLLWEDPLVTRYIAAGGRLGPGAVRARLEGEIATLERHGVQYWPVFLLEGGRFIGCCGLRPCGREGTLEFGVHILPADWGRGYASEAGRAVIGYAFGKPGVRSLFAGHHPGNAASRILLQRLGFTYEGDERYEPTGLMHPSYTLERPA